MTSPPPSKQVTWLKHDEKRFVFVALLGEGTFGRVFTMRDTTHDNAIVAVKRYKRSIVVKDETTTMRDTMPYDALREIDILMTLTHPNIIQLIEVCLYDNNDIDLVMPPWPQDLNTVLEEYNKINCRLAPSIIIAFTAQLASALTYCHQRRICHRDLKPRNILVNMGGDMRQPRVCIADWGASRVALGRTFLTPLPKLQQYNNNNGGMTSNVCTLTTTAPEMLLGDNQYDYKIDVWALGCIIMQMWQGKPLFHGYNDIDQLFHIFSLRGTPTPDTWLGITNYRNYMPNFPMWKPRSLDSIMKKPHHHIMPLWFVTLCERMLTLDPQQRCSAKDIVDTMQKYNQ